MRRRQHVPLAGALAGALAAVVTTITFSAVPAQAAAGPVLSVTAAGSFFPFHDGYEDVFAVTVTTDEQATAHLYLRSGSRVVSRGVQALDEDAPVTVTAGKGLRPGRYTWDLVVTDLAGNSTTTALRPVLADGRHLVSTRESSVTPVGKLAATLNGGSCATVKRTGGGILLTSSLQCPSAVYDADTATASLTVPLKPGVGYLKLQVSAKSTGDNGVLSVFDGGTQHIAAAGPVQARATALTLPGTVVTASHTLRLEVQTSAGEKLTLQSVRVGYVLETLG